MKRTSCRAIADDLQLLLDFFELDKALYEVNYEIGHRPDWVRIPMPRNQRCHRQE